MSLSPEIVGSLAAVITSLCWFPQVFKMLRERDTSGISLATNAAFASGVALWLVYGLMVGAWPVIAANLVTLGCILVIVGLKLRFG